MLKNFVKLFSGDPTKKTVAQFGDLAVQVNALEAEFEALSDEALRLKTDEFRQRLAQELNGIEFEDEDDRRCHPLRAGIGRQEISALSIE